MSKLGSNFVVLPWFYWARRRTEELKVYSCKSENLLTFSSLHINIIYRRYHIITPLAFWDMHAQDTLKVETFAKKSFVFLLFWGKFTKVWNREIYNLVAFFLKVNFRENVQFFGRKSCFSRKMFFSPKAYNYNIRFYQYLLN